MARWRIIPAIKFNYSQSKKNAKSEFSQAKAKETFGHKSIPKQQKKKEKETAKNGNK